MVFLQIALSMMQKEAQCNSRRQVVAEQIKMAIFVDYKAFCPCMRLKGILKKEI